ncbi:CubicO group peptidase (beta-lactamase class C family) [Pontibacter ummariensis]|uniref:CubicO group peptidase, beta-lactamase class C family n=1 Tax=Pontibacter ummariensis TaxID=1610492 RepID=A0A239H0M5_9BACT|nr:serine hydrolase [Pontibacter ummariensis]PRY10959.1 CubicO group peptidase (beta-lactamase class C family) [Pontibacter ummariensis]SNS74343.1 CubicO group peptidase, beta-lactamase class C family [Pontibacter ummariensis]
MTTLTPYFTRLRVLLLLVALLVQAPAWAQSGHKVDLNKLDAYYQKALKDWDVPGMAIAIVKDDSIIFSKGYGVRHNKAGGEVDANTLFGIASNTKAYTAAALATLVDQGKISWKDKVKQYVPSLQLYSPYVTENLTIEDLLSHRAGYKTFSGDLLWYNTTYSRPEIIERMRYLEPTYGFRDGYGYSNLMYIVAGEVIEKVTGKSWENYIQETFLQPLGMERTYTSVNDLKGVQNVASPHGFDEHGKPYATTLTAWDSWNPAAGIFTSVNQDAQWLRLQLNRGTYKGKQVFSEDASRNMWTLHNPFPVSKQSEELNPSTHFTGTGLGWFLSDYQGRKLVYHGGGHEGMNSRTVLVPEENLGIVILTNSMSSIMSPIASYTIDQFLGIESGRDWSQLALDAKAAAQKADEAAAVKVIKEKKPRKSKPTMDLAAYTGTYHSELYGNATVKLKDGKLELQLEPAPTLGGTLHHLQHDIFNLDWKNDYALLHPTNVRFLIGEDGAIAAMRLDSDNPDFHFDELQFSKVAQ